MVPASADGGTHAGFAMFGEGEKGEGGIERLRGCFVIGAPAAVGGLGAKEEVEGGSGVGEVEGRGGCRGAVRVGAPEPFSGRGVLCNPPAGQRGQGGSVGGG